MGKAKKYRELILQRIRQRNWEKRNRRKKKFERGNTQPIEKRIGLPVPRKFRRTNNLKNFSQTKNNRTPNLKRNYYLSKHLPINLNYLLMTEKSPLFLEKIKKENYRTEGIIEIPKMFSIIEAPVESYLSLKKIISALLLEGNQEVILDYKNCEKVGLGTQVLLDIILIDFLRFSNKCRQIDRNHKDYFPIKIGGVNINNEEVQKMMFSVGSPVTLKVREQNFSDIIPYKLCIHDNEKEKDYNKRIEKKELDTTEMADYVIDSLARMNKKLTPTRIDDLCTVIGEILINAEEHSTTKFRFSIGYFKEEKIENKHYGIFRLVILNFGKTIYEKFKDDDCPNKEIVAKMKELSKAYTRKKFFSLNKFEEENLWSLYALQEGVSSVSPTDFKRGNGSIRFIDSFFNIKGSIEVDNISNLNIQSGNTRIHFNGEYSIVTKTNFNNDTFKVMTFNKSGNIEEKPDSRFVFQTKYYFPGTIISAKLFFNDDDFEKINQIKHGN